MNSAATSSPEWIESLARIDGCELHCNEPLARHTTMGVGGPARWLLVAQDRRALIESVGLLRQARADWMVLGGGSNTLVGDAGYDGVVVKLGREFRRTSPGPGPGQLTSGAATSLSAVMQFARRSGLSGLEWAAGIPGTLGGALAGNAGTAAGQICALTDSAEVLDESGVPTRLARGQWTFGYRSSQLARHVILEATLALAPDAAHAIEQRMEAALARRRQQPLGVRCAGCVFKNPPGDSAGRLIDAAGLKGLRVGGAHVAQEHANFILNDGTATASDIFALMALIRRGVRERWGVNLELEIRTVGLDSLK